MSPLPLAPAPPPLAPACCASPEPPLGVGPPPASPLALCSQYQVSMPSSDCLTAFASGRCLGFDCMQLRSAQQGEGSGRHMRVLYVSHGHVRTGVTCMHGDPCSCKPPETRPCDSLLDKEEKLGQAPDSGVGVGIEHKVKVDPHAALVVLHPGLPP